MLPLKKVEIIDVASFDDFESRKKRSQDLAPKGNQLETDRFQLTQKWQVWFLWLGGGVGWV